MLKIIVFFIIIWIWVILLDQPDGGDHAQNVSEYTELNYLCTIEHLFMSFSVQTLLNHFNANFAPRSYGTVQPTRIIYFHFLQFKWTNINSFFGHRVISTSMVSNKFACKTVLLCLYADVVWLCVLYATAMNQIGFYFGIEKATMRHNIKNNTTHIQIVRVYEINIDL